MQSCIEFHLYFDPVWIVILCSQGYIWKTFGCLFVLYVIYSLYSMLYTRPIWMSLYCAAESLVPLILLPSCAVPRLSWNEPFPTVAKALKNWVWQGFFFPLQCHRRFLCLVILAASVSTLWFPRIAVTGYKPGNLLCFKWHPIRKRKTAREGQAHQRAGSFLFPSMT